MIHARTLAVAACFVAAFTACATARTAMPHARSGFVTEVKDGRLWVFREGSKDLEEFKKHGEPAKSVTRIGAGPGGMTIRSGDEKTIEEYLTAR